MALKNVIVTLQAPNRCCVNRWVVSALVVQMSLVVRVRSALLVFTDSDLMDVDPVNATTSGQWTTSVIPFLDSASVEVTLTEGNVTSASQDTGIIPIARDVTVMVTPIPVIPKPERVSDVGITHQDQTARFVNEDSTETLS